MPNEDGKRPTFGLEELAHLVDHHQVILVPGLFTELTPPRGEQLQDLDKDGIQGTGGFLREGPDDLIEELLRGHLQVKGKPAVLHTGIQDLLSAARYHMQQQGIGCRGYCVCGDSRSQEGGKSGEGRGRSKGKRKRKRLRSRPGWRSSRSWSSPSEAKCHRP